MINYKRFIQIAGIIDQQEAEMLIECGVKFLGFPLRLPVHKEDLTEEYAAKIISTFPADVHGVLITYLSDAGEISELMRFLKVNIVQLHGEIQKEEIIKLRKLLPDISIIKSLVVHSNYTDLKNIVTNLSDNVDAFITDTFDPETGASGATGKTHDWEISKKLIQQSPKPVILAGGLNHKNVRKAIMEVRPAGVDSHTGVEGADGRKEKSKVLEFVRQSELAFDSLGF